LNRTPSNPSEADELLFNVAGLLAEPAGYVEELFVDTPPLRLEDGPAQMRGVTGELHLLRTNRGLIARATLGTALRLSCSRCLTDIIYPVEFKIDEEALPSIDFATGAAVTLEEDDSDVLRLTDHHELNLNNVVRDAIMLSEPIAPLCREDCPGLCVTCGYELAGEPHYHADQDIDPRLEALRELLDASDRD